MADNPYPIPRQLRETDILVGNGGDTYGPFSFEVFDPEDIVVYAMPHGEPRFLPVDGVVVTKVNGNNVFNPLDFFTIKFPANIPDTTRFVVISARLASRVVGVISGAKINPDALEKEFSKIAMQLQEVRRDVDRAWRSNPGVPGMVLDADLADGDLFMKLGDRIVRGPNAGEVSSAQDYAQLAAEAAAEASAIGAAVLFRVYPSVSVAQLADLGPSVSYIAIAEGVDGTRFYKRLAADPGTGDRFQSVDGGWWQGVPYATIADGSITAAKLPPANDPISLPSIRKRLRSIPDLGDYGIYGGATDWGASDFTAMEEALFADGHAKILVPKGGNIRLAEQITITRGVMFEGEGKSNSVFSFFHNANGFVFTGQNGTGGGMKDLSVVKGNAGNANSFISCLANVGGWAPDFLILDGVNITGLSAGGTASYSLLLDGIPRNGSAANGLVGLRNLILRDLDIFNATFTTLEIRACRAMRMSGVNVFQGVGSVSRTVINGTSSNQSSVIAIQGSVLGSLNVDWANTINGYPNNIQNVTVSANASGNQIGRALGVVSNSSPSTTVFV